MLFTRTDDTFHCNGDLNSAVTICGWQHTKYELVRLMIMAAGPNALGRSAFFVFSLLQSRSWPFPVGY